MLTETKTSGQACELPVRLGGGGGRVFELPVSSGIFPVRKTIHSGSEQPYFPAAGCNIRYHQ
jgi:hypothetical protein